MWRLPWPSQHWETLHRIDLHGHQESSRVAGRFSTTATNWDCFEASFPRNNIDQIDRHIYIYISILYVLLAFKWLVCTSFSMHIPARTTCHVVKRFCYYQVLLGGPTTASTTPQDPDPSRFGGGTSLVGFQTSISIQTSSQSACHPRQHPLQPCKLA